MKTTAWIQVAPKFDRFDRLADAAPKLMEALERLMNETDAHSQHILTTNHGAATYHAARAALSAARGDGAIKEAQS